MSRTQPPEKPNDPVERKVQLAGNSTFVVSLPKEWAVSQGVEPGASMYLYPHEDRLVAATETASVRDRTVTVDAGSLDDEAAVRRLEAAYTLGCERIVLTGLSGVDASVRRTLERTAGRLIGVTIREDADDRMTIVNVLDAGEVSLPQTISQARQLALEMHADAIEAVVTGDEERTQQVIAREDDVSRLFAFVARGFHRGLEDVHELDRLGTDRVEAFRDYRVARALEGIAEHATAIATIATRQAGPPAEPLGERLESAGGDSRAVVESALEEETGRAYERAETVTEAIADLDRDLREASDPDAYLYGTVVHRLRRTADDGLEIADARTESVLALEDH